MGEDDWLEAAHEDANGATVDLDDDPNLWTWICPDCGGESSGARWGSRMVCLDCHEASLLPPESGDDYIGLSLLD